MGLLKSDFLKQTRKAARIPLRELAERTGISYVYISQIENGKAMPGVDVLHRLCQGMGITIYDYLEAAGVAGRIPVRKSARRKMDGKGFEPSTPTLRTWCSPS